MAQTNGWQFSLTYNTPAGGWIGVTCPLKTQPRKTQVLSCSKREIGLDPSAHNGMEWALFLLNCKQDPAGAKKWAEIAAGRAEAENAISILYTATAFSGLLAAKESNLQNVQNALRKLSSLVGSGQDLPWGDEVTFLEASVALNEETRRDVKALAKQTIPRIKDPEYHERAERLTRVD